MEYNEYLNQIIRFNRDEDFLMMKEKYNEDSPYMPSASVSRI